MEPLDRLAADEARALTGVLFDLDDTLLDAGLLSLSAYSALCALRDGGLVLLGVTGRPASWGDVLARLWPVHGILTENGALGHVAEGGRVLRLDPCDESTRRERRAQLLRLAGGLLAERPGVKLTGDAEGRVTDIAVDIGEHTTLPEPEVRELEEAAARVGLRTVRSSIHLHLTLETWDKASGATRFLRQRHGVSPAEAVARFAFVGDSANDAAAFAAFHTTFGVANVRQAARHLPVLPRFVATRERGAGFAEIAARLLALR